MNLFQKIIHGGSIAGTSAFVMGSFWYYFTILKQMKEDKRMSSDGITLFRLNNIADTNKMIGNYIGFFGGLLVYNSSNCIFKKLKNM